MIRHFAMLFLTFSSTTVFCQLYNSVEYKFLTYLNKFQVDSLASIIAKDFIMERTYNGYVNNKATFLNGYVQSSKELNSKFQLQKVLSDTFPKVFELQDQSEYLNCLGVKPPKWIMTITVSQDNKVQMVKIDSTSSYSTYNSEMLKKGALFEKWAKRRYPKETEKQLYETYEHLMLRIREYCRSKK